MSNTTPPRTADAVDGPHKYGIDHVEGAAGAVNVLDNSNTDSTGANWTFSQTVRHYWRAMAICFACGVCAMGDGYQYKMPGNIVALKGFIRQMGSFDEEENKWALDSQQVAVWGGKGRETQRETTRTLLTSSPRSLCWCSRCHSPHRQLAC